MPLKLIPSILSPDLLFILASMGHGDEIVLADAHFPTSSICRAGPREVRADGLLIPALLEAVLTLLPLDTYVSKPVALMDRVPADKEKNLPVPIWETYKDIVNKAENQTVIFPFYAVVGLRECAQQLKARLKETGMKPERQLTEIRRCIHFSKSSIGIQDFGSVEVGIEMVERFSFYERAKKAFAVVHTGETAQYGNIILKKGVAL